MSKEIAVLGGGCFWCTEAVFKRLRGVESVIPGYAGGETENPTYYEVSHENTGHAEVIKIEFDPDVISFRTLIDIFWYVHDPTTRDRQGNDVGTQYRSIILYSSDVQKAQAEESKKEAQNDFKDPIVTEIVPLTNFFEAESYHHDYYAQNQNQPYCQVIIAPKVKKLLEKYLDKVK